MRTANDTPKISIHAASGFYLGFFVVSFFWGEGGGSRSRKKILSYAEARKTFSGLLGGLGHAPPEKVENIAFRIGSNRISGH